MIFSLSYIIRASFLLALVPLSSCSIKFSSIGEFNEESTCEICPKSKKGLQNSEPSLSLKSLNPSRPYDHDRLSFKIIRSHANLNNLDFDITKVKTKVKYRMKSGYNITYNGQEIALKDSDENVLIFDYTVIKFKFEESKDLLIEISEPRFVATDGFRKISRDNFYAISFKDVVDPKVKKVLPAGHPYNNPLKFLMEGFQFNVAGEIVQVDWVTSGAEVIGKFQTNSTFSTFQVEPKNGNAYPGLRCQEQSFPNINMTIGPNEKSLHLSQNNELCEIFPFQNVSLNAFNFRPNQSLKVHLGDRRFNLSASENTVSFYVGTDNYNAPIQVFAVDESSGEEIERIHSLSNVALSVPKMDFTFSVRDKVQESEIITAGEQISLKLNFVGALPKISNSQLQFFVMDDETNISIKGLNEEFTLTNAGKDVTINSADLFNNNVSDFKEMYKFCVKEVTARAFLSEPFCKSMRIYRPRISSLEVTPDHNQSTSNVTWSYNPISGPLFPAIFEVKDGEKVIFSKAVNSLTFNFNYTEMGLAFNKELKYGIFYQNSSYRKEEYYENTNSMTAKIEDKTRTVISEPKKWIGIVAGAITGALVIAILIVIRIRKNRALKLQKDPVFHSNPLYQAPA